MIYDNNKAEACYFPPLLGNGDLSFFPDAEGCLKHRGIWEGNRYNAPSPFLFRAGRRMAITETKEKPAGILSFGTFSFEWGEEPISFTQELVEDAGIVKSDCVYPDGESILSECFIHPRYCLYALKKCFTGHRKNASFTYRLAGYNKESEEAIVSSESKSGSNGIEVSFRMFGQKTYVGAVRILLDRPISVTEKGNEFTLTFSTQDKDEVCFYLFIADGLFFSDYRIELTEIENKIREIGFEGLKAETGAEWDHYFKEGYVKTGNERVDRIYRSGLYALKCITTRWSIPIGINDCYWDGRFFAFDEYYSFLGLIGANRTELAERVPTFRREVSLPVAIQRVSYTSGSNAARFPWETNEYGKEIAIPGIWHDHVFHMAVIGIGAFEYYEYTGDTEYLKKTYPLISACARFYTSYMIYESNGKLQVGRCCDLERLGGAVINPFMTACGIIKELEVTARVAELLGVDSDFRFECLEKSRRLKENLPEEGGRYVPFLGCPQKSVAVFACKFPFDVLDPRDTRVTNAWDDYIANESGFGNMYETGHRVSPWYACWKAEAFARSGRAEEAFTSLLQATESSGVFGEMFEINEPSVRMKPWFSTAEGIFLSAVNEMMIQSDGENIYVLPAYPVSEPSVSFRLAVKGGAIAEFKIEEGKIKSERIEMRKGLPEKTFTIWYRGVSHPLKAISQQAVSSTQFDR